MGFFYRLVSPMKIKITFLALLLSAGTTSAADPAWVIHSRGYGAVQVGMSIKEAEALLLTPLKLMDSPFSSNCFVAVPSKGHLGVYFMVDDGQITYAAATATTTPSDKGLKIGDAAARIKNYYDTSLQEEKSDYYPWVFYAWDKDNKHGVKYEISPVGQIQEIRGGNSTIRRIEGPCS